MFQIEDILMLTLLPSRGAPVDTSGSSSKITSTAVVLCSRPTDWLGPTTSISCTG